MTKPCTSVWTIIGIELARGIVADLYMIARGNKLPVLSVWLVIHSAVIVTGLLSLRLGRMRREVWQGSTPVS